MPLKNDSFPARTMPAPLTPMGSLPTSASSVAPVQAMQKLYDSYFASHDYARRYPVPNPATLRFLMEQGHAARAAAILDVGCGDGRYALALLDATQARITGCDISSAALEEFASRLQLRLDEHRVCLVHGQAQDIALINADGADTRHDLSLLLFGVLSHAGEQPARIAMLKAIAQQTKPDGLLLLTVPSILRRRPLEIIRAVWRKLTASKLQHEQMGDIEFARVIAGEKQEFFYHLYSVSDLKRDLALSGWELQSTEAESLLPEWLITQHAWIARLDGLIRPLLPAVLGYGIRAVARLAPQNNSNHQGR